LLYFQTDTLKHGLPSDKFATFVSILVLMEVTLRQDKYNELHLGCQVFSYLFVCFFQSLF
ncbi:MAG: hypothetical protein BWK80_15505, partial [Desulfobacteraceae bacterium IS3]